VAPVLDLLEDEDSSRGGLHDSLSEGFGRSGEAVRLESLALRLCAGSQGVKVEFAQPGIAVTDLR
jgi:hypothetical protein